MGAGYVPLKNNIAQMIGNLNIKRIKPMHGLLSIGTYLMDLHCHFSFTFIAIEKPTNSTDYFN